MKTLLSIVFLGWAALAQAGISVCNHSDEDIRVAFGYRTEDGERSRSLGWARINAQNCVHDAFPSAEDAGFELVFFRAESLTSSLSWTGRTQFCLKPSWPFDFDGFPPCQDPLVSLGFKKWDTSLDNKLLVLTRENAGESPLLSSPTRTVRICNRTPSPANVEIAYPVTENGVWMTEGIWSIDGGECKEVRRSFKGEQIFVFARSWSERAWLRWFGERTFCTNDGFQKYVQDYANQESCSGDKRLRPFMEFHFEEGLANVALTPHTARVADRMLNVCNWLPDYGIDAYAYAALVTDDDARPGERISHGWYLLPPKSCRLIYAVESPLVHVVVTKGQGIGGSFVSLDALGEQRQFCVARWATYYLAEPSFTSCSEPRNYWAPFYTWEVTPGKNTLDIF